jgi:hypothetical protein
MNIYKCDNCGLVTEIIYTMEIKKEITTDLYAHDDLETVLSGKRLLSLTHFCFNCFKKDILKQVINGDFHVIKYHIDSEERKKRHRLKQKQTCKVCDRPNIINFYVPDELWEAIVPEEYRTTVVCLYCFDGFAAEKNINYADSLKEICFCGDKASFEFDIKSATNLEHINNE